MTATAALNPKASSVLSAYFRSADHPMKGRIWRWVRALTGHRLLTIPYCGKGWLSVDEHDLVQRCILESGAYEPEVWDSLFTHASDREVVWDLGAHIGSFAVRSILDERVAEVHAFEPDPITHEFLKRNIDLNGNARVSCQLHAVAVGLTPGVGDLFRGPERNRGLSSIVAKPTDERFDVRVTTLDELIFSQGLTAPTLIKIDVEGAEVDVLRGGAECFRVHRPKAMVVEAAVDRNGELLDRAVIDACDRIGYTLQHISRPLKELHRRENFLCLPV